MTKKEIVQYLKQNMPTFTGNKIEKEKKMAMYIYLELGKMKAFDEKYFFGNSKTKDKIYKMAKCAKYNVDSVAQKKKIVCVSLAYLCKSIYSEFGIKSYISTPNGGDKHIYNIIQFSDGKKIKADLQQDLSNIQTKSRTTSFAQGYDCAEENLDVFSNEEIYEIQRQLGYVNDSSEYMDEKISDLAKKVRDLPPDKLLETVINDKEISRFNEQLEYIELYKHYRGVFYKTAGQYDKRNIYYCNCYRKTQDSDEKQYSMCIYSIYKDKIKAYLSSSKNNQFMEVDLRTLINLENQGLFIGAMQKENGVKLLQKHMNLERKKMVQERWNKNIEEKQKEM